MYTLYLRLRFRRLLPHHRPRVTVWCAFWADGVVGPYFFENTTGNALTVDGVRYREMLTKFLWPELDVIDVEDMFFQQDGRTCHTAGETMMLQQTKFPGGVISRFGDQHKPPRSCDLTHRYFFFLWGYVFRKRYRYANKHETVEHLKEEIRRVIGEIQPTFMRKRYSKFQQKNIPLPEVSWWPFA